MEELRGELWEGRAVDEKLKSSLEWHKGWGESLARGREYALCLHHISKTTSQY